jgi:hypothetical protein
MIISLNSCSTINGILSIFGLGSSKNQSNQSSTQTNKQTNTQTQISTQSTYEQLVLTYPISNPQNYLLYPAVGAAFTNLKEIFTEKSASMQDIYCLDNEFSIRRCAAARDSLYDLIFYRIKITAQNNQLTIEFSDLEGMAGGIVLFDDAEISKMPRLDTQKMSSQIKNEIERHLANATVYNEAKKAFFANNAFLNRAFTSVTNAMMNEFANTILKPGEISFNASILSVDQNKKTEFNNYSTEIYAGLYDNPPGSRAIAVIYLYTNDSGLARLRQSDKIALNGQLVRMERNALTQPVLIMTK